MSQLEPPVSVLPGLAPVIEISKWSGWRLETTQLQPPAPPSCTQ